MAEASSDQVRVINPILDVFCWSSGAKVNRIKTQVFFSKNVPAREAITLSNDLGFTITKDLVMPLFNSRVTNKTYHELVYKVDERLSGWNANHLSLVGRVTLAQSVIQVIPIYAMQTSIIPAGVKSKIDQSCRRFIWSGNYSH